MFVYRPDCAEMPALATATIARDNARSPGEDAAALAAPLAATPGRCWSWRDSAAATLIFLLALVARLSHIAAKPFWMDEITTIQRSSRPFLSMVADSLAFHHLPAYFLVTSWMVPFGTTEMLLRLPSVVAGALSCAIVFAVARALGGLRAGIVGGVLMAVSPLQIQYGQEARSYALLIAAIALALLGLMRLAQDPPRAALPLRVQGADRSGWIAYIGGTLGALNVLSAALLWWGASNLALALIYRSLRGDRGRFRRNWMLSQLVVAATCLPWFGAMYLFAHGDMANGLDWVPPLSAARLWSTLDAVYLMRISSLISGELFPEVVPCLGIAVALLALLGAAALRHRRSALAALAISFLLLPCTLLLISLVHPVWMPRYVLWSAAPFFVLVGIGTGMLPRRIQSPAVALLCGVAVINALPYYQAETKPRWNLAAEVLRAQMASSDLLLVSDPWAVRLMRFYMDRKGGALLPGQWTTSLDQAQARIAAGGRVWAVQGRIGQADHQGRADFLAWLSPLGAPTAQVQAGRDIILLRFDPPADSAQLGCAEGDQSAALAPQSGCNPS